jgi:hypothetical protein
MGDDTLTKNRLATAVERRLISAEQADALWNLFHEEETDPTRARFDLAHVLYYLGGVVVLAAMTVFLGLGWEQLGDGGLLLASALFTALYATLGGLLWRRPATKVPGGLLVTVAVFMVPLVTYALQRAAGWWPDGTPGDYQDFYSWIDGGWFAMEVATVLAAVLAIRWVRFAFLATPLALALWFASMDVAPLLSASESRYAWVSLATGAVILVAAFLLDRRTPQDFAFWLYLAGLAAYWGGHLALAQGGAWTWALFAAANVVLLALAVLLQRRVFLVFGALGIASYLGYLGGEFAESLAFPLVLSALGLAIIACGILYARLRSRLEQAVQARLPDTLRRALPQARPYGSAPAG